MLVRLLRFTQFQQFLTNILLSCSNDDQYRNTFHWELEIRAEKAVALKFLVDSILLSSIFEPFLKVVSHKCSHWSHQCFHHNVISERRFAISDSFLYLLLYEGFFSLLFAFLSVILFKVSSSLSSSFIFTWSSIRYLMILHNLVNFAWLSHHLLRFLHDWLWVSLNRWLI